MTTAHAYRRTANKTASGFVVCFSFALRRHTHRLVRVPIVVSGGSFCCLVVSTVAFTGPCRFPGRVTACFPSRRSPAGGLYSSCQLVRRSIRSLPTLPAAGRTSGPARGRNSRLGGKGSHPQVRRHRDWRLRGSHYKFVTPPMGRKGRGWREGNPPADAQNVGSPTV